MKTYAFLTSENPAAYKKALADLAQVQAFIEALPKPEHHEAMYGKSLNGLGKAHKGKYDRPVWTCHALTRAVLKACKLELPWEVRDGWFHRPGQNHSWLWFKRDDCELLLDVYPIGSILTQAWLLDASGGLWKSIYLVPSYGTEEFATFEAEATIAANAFFKETKAPR